MNTPLLLSRVVDAEIPCGKVMLEGDLRIPDAPDGLVVFAHGSGSSRLSPRNQYVAQRMRDHGFATLLFDMLTERETEAAVSFGTRRFDLGMLTSRLLAAIRWAQMQPSIGGMPVGIFGSSTGAASALSAAALLPDIAAVVCRGGRADLAGNQLDKVTAPTLFIAGSEDAPIVQRNSECLRRLRGVGQMSIIPGAGHLFEERGTLAEASRVAARWFAEHLRERDGEDD
jgi:putative phosphoribosyl transferase